MKLIARDQYNVYNENFAWIISVTNDIKFIKFVKLKENKVNMNNVNVNFEIEISSTERFSVSEKKSIINIKNIKSNYCINFAILKRNEIIKTFSEFRYNNVNKHDESCVYIFAIVIF